MCCCYFSILGQPQVTMPNNVEIKAQVNNIEELTKRARELSGTKGELLQQEDTFFMCQNGRLKLRVLQV